MKHTLFNLFALLVVLSLALTACGGGAATPTAAPVVTEAPAVVTEAPPVVTEAPAPVEKTVTIGFTASLTGAQEVSSKRQVNGFNLWMNQINETGGLALSDGTVVKFAAQNYDDESTKERVQELYTRLITEDNADFLISPYSSGLTAAAAVIAEQNGKLMITTGAADDDTYKQGYTGVFQLYTPGSLYLTSTVDMLKTLDPAAKIAIVHESDKFSTAVVNGLQPYAESQGFEIVLVEPYASDTADFGTIINKIVDSGATVVLGGGHYPDGSTFARQLFDRKIGIQFIGILVAPPDSKFSELGDAAFGVTGPSQWEAKATHTEAEANALGIEWYGPTGEEFSAAYEAAYGDPPTYHASGGYTAGLLLEKAIMNADSVDSEAVKAALDAMNLFTFYGGIKFDTSAEAHGLQIGHNMVVIQWQKNDAGELVREVIWPADVATKDPIFPIPAP
jgi:ABC-type branched-subunit amino acid transport system substrate-binding protein